jgi:hypothetical protein
MATCLEFCNGACLTKINSWVVQAFGASIISDWQMTIGTVIAQLAVIDAASVTAVIVEIIPAAAVVRNIRILVCIHRSTPSAFSAESAIQIIFVDSANHATVFAVFVATATRTSKLLVCMITFDNIGSVVVDGHL